MTLIRFAHSEWIDLGFLIFFEYGIECINLLRFKIILSYSYEPGRMFSTTPGDAFLKITLV